MEHYREIGYFQNILKIYADLSDIVVGNKPGREISEERTIACNLELLKILRTNHVPVAIATSSTLPSINPIMAEHEIEVDAVVTADDVERGKPFPDLFLCAAAKLAVPPEHCVVIEAARAAGMKSLRFHKL